MYKISLTECFLSVYFLYIYLAFYLALYLFSFLSVYFFSIQRHHGSPPPLAPPPSHLEQPGALT